MAARFSLILFSIVIAVVGCQDSAVDPAPRPVLRHVSAAQPAPIEAYRVAPARPGTLAVRQPAASAVPAGWVPPVPPRPWKWIIIHHSATPAGNAYVFDKMHRDKGWDELGYDFVIGNGTDSADGLIEVGPRWTKQKWGAHTKTPDNRFNDFGVGICLVGDFDQTRPTAAQMRSLTKLVAYLMKTYRIGPENIIGHSDTKATDCPGRYMSVALVRQLAVQSLAASGTPVQSAPLASGGEMLQETGKR